MKFKVKWMRYATVLSIASGLTANFLFGLGSNTSIMIMMVTLLLVLFVGALMPENEQATQEMKESQNRKQMGKE